MTVDRYRGGADCALHVSGAGDRGQRRGRLVIQGGWVILCLVGPLQLGSGAWPHAVLLRTARLEPPPSVSFAQIRSTSVTDARCEDKAVTHCQGRVLRPACSLFDEQGQLCVAPSMPAAKQLRLKDIGREGRYAETHVRFFIGWSRRWCEEV